MRFDLLTAAAKRSRVQADDKFIVLEVRTRTGLSAPQQTSLALPSKWEWLGAELLSGHAIHALPT